MKIHHIGYLVKKIDKAIGSFEAIGYVVTVNPIWDEDRKASICFLENDGYRVELICPSEDSPIYPLLKQFGNAPYHIGYQCDNLENAINELKVQKFMLFKDPAPAPAISEKAKVAFLQSARIGMIELVEEK